MATANANLDGNGTSEVCFWHGRGKGLCSPDVMGRAIVPGQPLTTPNILVECRAHSQQRGAMSIGEYLASGHKTGTLSDEV